MRDHLPLPEPWNIENVSDYINQLVSFITKYESIAKFNSHDIFLHGLPVGWVGEHSLETWMAIMSGESLDGLSDRVTGEFSEFARLSHALPLVDERKQNKTTAKKQRKGMTPKKDHEVDAMIAFINEMTRIHNIDVNNVLDVGCGLGYLSLELSKGGYNVIGVEGDPDRAEKAGMHARFQCITRKVYDCNDLDIMKEGCISVSLRIINGCGC